MFFWLAESIWYYGCSGILDLVRVAMAKGKSSGGSRTVNKSAVTGRFVSYKTVKSSPKTTYKQTVKK